MKSRFERIGRRAGCLLLALTLLLPLTGCASDPEETAPAAEIGAAGTDAEPAAEETEPEIDPALLDELPASADFGGHEFVVVSHDHAASAVAWMVADIEAESLNGERINDAVFERNLQMEERFNVKVKQNLQTDPAGTARSLITAGDDSYDLLQTTVQNQCSMVMQGYLIDMNALPYLNFDKAWWDSTAIEGITVANRIYYAIGDSMLNGKKATWVVLFNKMLTENAGLPNLYDMVREGSWTLDRLQEFAEQIALDENGDGAMTWGDDLFGLALQNEVALPLLLGTGVKLIDVQDDGTFQYNLNSQGVVDAMERINSFLKKSNSYILNANHYNDKANLWIELRNLFMADRFAFFMAHLGTVTLVGGDMNSDFGILPFPKLNAEQDGYYSTFQYNNAHAISIPKTAGDLERSGMLTEAYEMLSHGTVMEAYYDYTLTLRNARDTDSGEMLDLIFGSRNFDISLAFNSSTSMQSFLEAEATADTFNYASAEKTKQKATNKIMENVLKSVLAEGE